MSAEANLKGKVALVTGAGSGIGRAVAEALHAGGAQVLAHHRRREPPAGERIAPLAADLGDAGAVESLWERGLGVCGRIDVLVNNAGIFEEAPLESDAEAWRDAWLETLQVNLVAAAQLCRRAVLHFRERPGGGIVINVSSRAAFRGDELRYAHYAASKAALVALTRTLARGLAGEGVAAYDVAPGLTDTPMVAQLLAARGREPLLREIPMGELASAEEVAALVAFLASGRALHATGTTIHLNGASYVH